MIGRTLSHYTLVEKIGVGGMGEVYRARDTRLRRDVALKVLPAGLMSDRKARQRLRREALALSRISHPNIAVIHDLDADRGVDFLVMEFVPGQTLAAMIGEQPLPDGVVLAIGAQVAAALAEAHRAGVVHRDLKPVNIIVTPAKVAKVLDFGLAILLRQDEETTQSQDLSSAFAGTLPYMAPEQLRGEAVDARTDIYAFGAVLYAMTTGRRPFSASTRISLMQSMLEGEPTPPSKHNPRIAPLLEAVIVKCLDRAPDRRYQSVREIEIDLERLRSPSPSAAPPRASSRSARARSRRPKQRVAASPTATGGRLSIVAMPAKVFGSEADAFLTDAIANSLSTHLAQVDGLEMKVPPSKVDVERVGNDFVKIAAAYRANRCLLSSASIEEGRLVLDVQVVDPRARQVMWSREFEGDRSHYVALVREAADGVRAALRPDSGPPAAAGASATDSEGELLMQRGLYYAHLYGSRRRSGDFDRAIDAFNAALAAGPRSARAAAEIAALHLARLTAGVSMFEVAPVAERFARQALEIDPRCAKAWAVLSRVQAEGRPEGHRQKLAYALKAASFGPRDAFAHAMLSRVLALDSYELALSASSMASDLDPLTLDSPLFQGLAHAMMGRADQAMERVDRALDLEPDLPFGLLVKALVLTTIGRAAEAFHLVEPLERLAGERRLDASWVRFSRDLAAFAVAFDTHDVAAADDLAVRLLATARGEHPFPRWQYTTQGVAPQLARAGRCEAAMQLLLLRTEAGLPDALDYLLSCPDLAPLRGDERFLVPLRAARGRFDETLSMLEEARQREELPAYLHSALAELLARLGTAG